MNREELDQKAINVLKGLVIDGVHKAKSGHPGGALSSMDFAYILFTEYLQFDPHDPHWLGRDRFVLSAGHESMLIYSLLHAIGWLPLDELKRFRQLHSKTPGHPENFVTTGVECTTGPLGQGAAMSVGMAVAGKHLSAQLGQEFFNHQTYALLGDGCMQEDVTLGAASLAGHLGLSNLVWFYDKNRQQISGGIDRATSDDEAQIFKGLGWDVITIDGHDHRAIRATLDGVRAGKHQRPLLIVGTTVMAKGAATMEGQHKTHGEPLPAEERINTKAKLGLPADQDFYCPSEMVSHFQRRFPELKQRSTHWKKALAERQKDADFKKLWHRYFDPPAPKTLSRVEWPRDKSIATRNAFGDVIKQWCAELPSLIGGSADLEPSNMTGPFAKLVGDFSRTNPKGRNLAFGVREFPMSALANGLALHGGLIPFDATFLTFADYSRPALRLGAIQKVRVIHEFTHDSFYLGEDGPTHQPVEHLMALRLIPDFYVMRPADPYETEVLMRVAIGLKAPSAVCLSRQKVPFLEIPYEEVQQAAKGAYVVFGQNDSNKSERIDLILMATGSEVGLAIDVAKQMRADAKSRFKSVRVVSMPCWELFLEEPAAYQEKILPAHCTARVSIEAGSTLGWQKFTGGRGLNIGLDHYGASAPMEDLAKEFGFTSEKIAARIAGHAF